MEFEEVAAHFGYSLGGGAIPVKKFADDRPAGATAAKCAAKSCSPRRIQAITSRNYQKLVAKIEGKPEERILSYLMLRSLKQARYSERKRRPLRAGRGHLHALHFAHSPLSRT